MRQAQLANINMRHCLITIQRCTCFRGDNWTWKISDMHCH